ncbi:carboxyl transferase domain-containing protein [Streptomyces peucetius]|uniref:Acetyl-coenzyme A carboxylase carboxyl transferase subunits beta/alpha n=1 Tax=Streptomyces peucetius TaxID=1950 RepID=A0ABY6I7Z0_STRPE|nr:carboxyl transferase domain-containing protein [Streptomyces peucetius]UYQ61967.1 acetyl-CoA carboxylase [Streptomyces peucetius]
MAERVSAREAIALVCDVFTEQEPAELPDTGDGPLGWEGYGAQRTRASRRTGSAESVVHGTATVGGTACVLISFEFGFLGGSLSERAGDRLEAAYTLARERRLPLVSLIATGGSRMQEGMVALSQLQRVARASALLREARVGHIAVLRDPTTGGGWATLGAGADVILALPGAQVGFAGSRVRPADADPAAYTAEGQLAAGQIDAIVPPEALRDTLAFWVTALGGAAGSGAAEGSGPGGSLPHAVAPPRALGAGGAWPQCGWDAVWQARAAERPRARAYLDDYFTRRQPLRGDRCGGHDPGMLCGVGLREGRPVVYAAQCGTATTPAGYRTAARVVRLADRLGLPVLTLVDTPGAANGADAERHGAGAAIAELFGAVAAARTPLTSLLIGEGGSGGALALAAPGNTWATPDSYFSVIAPELAAAILKRSPDQVPHTADQLRLRPQDLVELGVVRGIVEAAG